MEEHLDTEHSVIPASSGCQSGSQLTQAGSPPVHPEISRIDSEMRAASGERRQLLKADLAHAKNGPDRPNGKRFIGRQMTVSAGTYKGREPQWLKRSKARLAAPGEGENARG